MFLAMKRRQVLPPLTSPGPEIDESDRKAAPMWSCLDPWSLISNKIHNNILRILLLISHLSDICSLAVILTTRLIAFAFHLWGVWAKLRSLTLIKGFIKKMCLIDSSI